MKNQRKSIQNHGKAIKSIQNHGKAIKSIQNHGKAIKIMKIKEKSKKNQAKPLKLMKIHPKSQTSLPGVYLQAGHVKNNTKQTIKNYNFLSDI